MTESKTAGIQFAASPDPDINKKSMNSANNAPSTAASNWDFWTIVKWVAVGVGILGAFVGVVYCIRNGMPDFDFDNKGGSRGNPSSPPPSSTTSTNNGTDAVATAAVETVTPEITAAAQAVGETAAKAVQAAVEVLVPVVDPVIPPEADVVREVVAQTATGVAVPIIDPITPPGVEVVQEVIREVVQAPVEVAAPIIEPPMAPPGAEVVQEVVMRGAEAVVQRTEVIREAARRVPPQPAAPAIGGNGDPLRGNIDAILNKGILEFSKGQILTVREFGIFANQVITDAVLAYEDKEDMAQHQYSLRCFRVFVSKMERLEARGQLPGASIAQLEWAKQYYDAAHDFFLSRKRKLPQEKRAELLEQIALLREQRPKSI